MPVVSRDVIWVCLKFVSFPRPASQCAPEVEVPRAISRVDASLFRHVTSGPIKEMHWAVALRGNALRPQTAFWALKMFANGRAERTSPMSWVIPPCANGFSQLLPNHTEPETMRCSAASLDRLGFDGAPHDPEHPEFDVRAAVVRSVTAGGLPMRSLGTVVVRWRPVPRTGAHVSVSDDALIESSDGVLQSLAHCSDDSVTHRHQTPGDEGALACQWCWWTRSLLMVARRGSAMRS